MFAFITSYLIVWLLVGLYVVQLGDRQRKLGDRLAALQRQLQPEGNPPVQRWE